jgi:hypothetical protein
MFKILLWLEKQSKLESSELETVTSPGRLSKDLRDGDGDGDGKMGGGEPMDDATGDTMGLSRLSGRDPGVGMLVVCMLLFSPTVKSLVTRRVLRGTTGVPKDC